MKIAIMQPYLFPYIGYFQLIQAVDTFVIYDDVNFIKQGWINRNYILLDNKRRLFTLQLNGASSFKLINQIQIGNNKEKLLKTFKQAYAKAPYYKENIRIIEDIIVCEEKNLARYLINGILKLAGYLAMSTKFVISSELEKNGEYKAQDKVIDICERLKADHYINAIGGLELYSRKKFNEKGIKLSFIKSAALAYAQASNEHVPSLSIIDLLMFNSKDQLRKKLNEYALL